MGLAALFRRKPYERVGFELYGAAVAAARQPHLYEAIAVPDTAAGRFEMVCLHAGLLIQRINRDGDKPAQNLAQAVFDAMFADMDLNLREMGTSDLRVGTRVKMLWEGFHGRTQAYAAAIEAGDDAGLAAALERNVWVAEPAPDGAPALLATYARRLTELLASQGFETLSKGQVRLA